MFEITPEIENLIDRALTEDLSMGDITTEAIIPTSIIGTGILQTNSEGILAGINVSLAVFHRVDPTLKTDHFINDGSTIHPGDTIASISGKVSSILKAERTALNFLQHLSGIATKTNSYVQAVSKYKSQILDTRKTTPGLRTLEKYAVRMGGGYNHRGNLGTGILVKDNHIQTLINNGFELIDIVKHAIDKTPHTMKTEIEIENFKQAKDALESGANLLLLDNMSTDEMIEVVKIAEGKAITEASGGINLNTVEKVAATGVDFISIGALTHSVTSLDLSLNISPN